jgi:hypothetical protein
VGEDEADEGEEDDEVVEQEQVERAFEVVLWACSRIGSAIRRRVVLATGSST